MSSPHGESGVIMERSSEAAQRAIEEQAAEWHAQQHTSEASSDRNAALAAWLRASPAHVEAYLRVAVVASELSVTATPPLYTVEALLADARDAPPVVTALPERAGVAARRRPPGYRRAAMAAVVAVAGLLAVLWGSRPTAPTNDAQVLTTGHGELRSWMLADGSTLELDVESSARIEFGASERRVRLMQGRVFVHVAKGDPRPLRVVTGDAVVEATGTQFDVRRQPDRVTVTLTEGHVNVSPASEAPESGSARAAVALHAGEQVVVMRGTVSVPRRVDVDRLEAWRSGRVVADRLSLGEAVSEFQRFSTVPITVQDRSLAAVPISGAFDARDLDTFLGFLEATEGVRVDRSAQAIVITRRLATRAGGTSSIR